MFGDIKKYILPVFTSFWIFLIFFLGNSFLSYYFLFAFLLISIFFWNNLNLPSIGLIKKYSIGWIILLIFSGLSLLWTQNIPYSLDYYIFFLFIFYIFHFFYLIKKKYFDFELFFVSLGFLGLALIFFSLLFTYIPNLGEKLPPTNLLYSSSGHTHLSTLSLFMIPGMFFYFLKHKDKKYLFLIGVYSLFGFLSMGRIISAIIVLEHLLIFILFKRKEIFSSLDKKYRKFLFSYFKIFLSFLASSLFVWFILFSQCGGLNQNDFKTIKACRYGSGESRIQYWKTAQQVIKNNFLGGVGLGNYHLFSKKYVENRETISSYPHNHFLKMFAELGVFGGSLFALVFVGLFIQGLRSSFKEKFSIKIFLGISLLGIFINSFFDFDWSFEGIFILTAIFLGVLVSRLEKTKEISNKFFNITFFIIYFICILAMSFYFMVDSLASSGREKEAFALLPFSKWHSVLYAKSPNLSDEDKEKLYFFNKKNNLVLQSLAESSLDKDFKKKVLIKLNDVYPWNGFYLSLDFLYDESFSLEEKEEFIYEMISFLEQREEEFGELLEYEKLTNFMEKIFSIADEFYMKGDYEAAGELYIATRRIDIWSLNFHKPIFVSIDSNKDKISFFASFSNIEYKYLGQYGLFYKDYIKYFVEKSLESSSYDIELINSVKKIIEFWDEESS